MATDYEEDIYEIISHAHIGLWLQLQRLNKL